MKYQTYKYEKDGKTGKVNLNFSFPDNADGESDKNIFLDLLKEAVLQLEEELKR